MNIIEEIRKLDLPVSEYVVIGGAAMSARGLKNTEDIDIVVSEVLMTQISENKSWKSHPRMVPNEAPGLINDDGTIQLYPTVGGVEITFEELKQNSESIEGIPFASLENIILIKETYGREKDLVDVQRIKDYLESKK